MNYNWFEQIKYYASNFGVSDYTLYIPLATIITFIVIFAIHLYFFKDSKNKVTDKLNRSAFYAITITTVTYLIAIFVLKRFTELIANEQCELIILVILLILCSFAIYFIVKGKILFSKTKEQLLIGFPISGRIRNEVLNNQRKQFNRRKFYWLLTLLPFMILFIQPNTKYLYSIVIDNSGSMDEYLTYGVNSFGSALSYSPKGAEYILSYLPICNDTLDCMHKAEKLKSNLTELVKISNPDDLGTLTYSYDNSQNVINTISQDISISGIGSPISEAIWQNYLTAKKTINNFKEKRMIILTDGADNLYYQNNKVISKIGKSILNAKTKDGISPLDFYDKVFFINEGGDPSLYLFADADVEILDGSNQSQYYKSVQSVMSLLSFDLIFVYISLFLVSITLIVILLINPRITN